MNCRTQDSPIHPVCSSDLWRLCGRALADARAAADLPELDARDQHLAHLFSLLLAPTHPMAAGNLAHAAAGIQFMDAEQRTARWIMHRYQITDLPWVRNSLVAILGEEDRSQDLRRRMRRPSGFITIDMDLPAGRGLLAYLEALGARANQARKEGVIAPESISAFISGGLLAHLYTGVHPCYAIELQLSAAVPNSGDIVIDLVDDAGMSQLAYLDHSSTSAKGLWHPEAFDRCLPIFAAVKGFDLEVPRPIDLAVNMCSSLTQSQGLWITAMARAGLYSEDEFRGHAAQTLVESTADDATLAVYESHVELAAKLIELAMRPAANNRIRQARMFDGRNTG